MVRGLEGLYKAMGSVVVDGGVFGVMECLDSEGQVKWRRCTRSPGSLARLLPLQARTVPGS